MSTFSFGDKEIAAEPGQSIGAALIAAGYRSWRTTRHSGAPRGVFCGIGICFDCLVMVNGSPNQRACLTEAHDGDKVEPQEGTGHTRCRERAIADVERPERPFRDTADVAKGPFGTAHPGPDTGEAGHGR